MTRAAWLSVILPTHHGERWLDATLASLAAQTMQGFECILIDSSLDDATLAIARRYRDRLDLRVDHRPDLQTWQAKTNLGAALARADHLCMLHQDDLWLPTRAARVSSWLDASPEILLHLHPSYIVDDEGRRLGLWRCPLRADAALAPTMVVERLIVQNFVSICAPVIRVDGYLACGGLDETLWYTADWDLYLKLARNGGVRYHREPLTCYRIHPNALTVSGSRKAAEFEAQLVTVLERNLGAIGAGRRGLVARARASIAINTALAGAFHKSRAGLPRAIVAIARLGPTGMLAFLRDTRLVERVMPRLRAFVFRRLALRA